MSARDFAYTLLSVALGGAVTGPVQGQAPAANPAAAAAMAPQGAGEPQVLDQGPIHEAFADPGALEAKPRVLINRQPPEPINEMAPEVKPEGENIEWIPGYWMWSDEQQDFVWVSGLWRDAPPGRRWVPGHWLQEGPSWIWISGFWAGADWQQVQMLPNPPATLEAGPSSPAPGDNYFWIPGCWIWNNGGYAWRPGYWYVGQPNWVWVPDTYYYTPAGSIFVNGYWDRPLWTRGWLFAPVWWPQHRFGVGFTFTPRYAIDSSLLLSSLFINTRYNSFWFGYGGWANDFYRPWWYAGGRNHWHNPIWAYHRWHDGHRHDWDDHWRGQWNRWHGDGDKRFAGRPGGRPGNGRPGDGRPGDGRLGDRRLGDGRPGDGRPGGGRGDGEAIRERLVRDIQGGRPGARRIEVSDAERAALRLQADQWAQLRTARVQAETQGRGEAARRAGGVNAGGAGNVGGNAAALQPRPGFRLPNADRLPGNRGEVAQGQFRRGPVQVGGAGSTPGAISSGNPTAGDALERRAAYRGGSGAGVGQPGGRVQAGGGRQELQLGSPWGGGAAGGQQNLPGRQSRSQNSLPPQFRSNGGGVGGGQTGGSYRTLPADAGLPSNAGSLPGAAVQRRTGGWSPGSGPQFQGGGRPGGNFRPQSPSGGTGGSPGSSFRLPGVGGGAIDRGGNRGGSFSPGRSDAIRAPSSGGGASFRGGGGGGGPVIRGSAGGGGGGGEGRAFRGGGGGGGGNGGGRRGR